MLLSSNVACRFWLEDKSGPRLADLSIDSSLLSFVSKYNNTGHNAADWLNALLKVSSRVTAKHINYE